MSRSGVKKYLSKSAKRIFSKELFNIKQTLHGFHNHIVGEQIKLLLQIINHNDIFNATDLH